MAEDVKVEVTDYMPQFTEAIGKVIGNEAFGKAFPSTMMAMNFLAHKYLIKWRGFTSGEEIPGTPRVINSRGDYTRSINIDVTDEQVKYIYSQGPWTERIEKGHGEIDLKPGLLSGPKARAGEKGPYNIVAFRHGTTSDPSNNPMPINVYNLIKRETDKIERQGGVGMSRQTGKGPGKIQRASGKQDLKTNYQWGYRLPSSQGGTPKTKKTSQGDYTWKTGKHSDMARMDTSTSKMRNSQYVTFRTVSIHSDPASWIIPPKDPLPIRDKVKEAMREETETMLRQAMNEDLSRG